jgi:hypothetical protein
MKLVSARREVAGTDPATETITLTRQHAAFLNHVSHGINPQMPEVFGWPHAIRTILDRIEESGIDLTEARNERDIARLAAAELRNQSRRRTVT